MAFCPKCKGAVSATEIVCPHCGYDFPAVMAETSSQKSGIAYSPLAEIALIVSTAAASIGCLVAIGFSLLSLFSGLMFPGLVLGPIAFFTQLGLVVVFLRVQDL